jgi:phage shock protein C
MIMTGARSIVGRDDTLLGVCFALGEDFGFNPVYLRVLLAAVVLWSLPAALGAYAALGALVAVSRWMAPDPPPAEAAAAHAPDCVEPCEELRLAA